MLKKLSFLLLVSALIAENQAVTFIQVISDDTQANQYRGLQLGIWVEQDGLTSPAWAARVRFADKDQQVCSGNASLPWAYTLGMCAAASGAFALDGIGPQAMFATLAAGITPLLHTAYNQSLAYWDSKVFIRTSHPHEKQRSDQHLTVSVAPKPIERRSKSVVFEWQVPGYMSEDDFFIRLNSLRTTLGGPFPAYTLSGVGGRHDGLNCVSFTVRLGKLLGVPFQDDPQLALYTDAKKRAMLPWDWREKAATPERVLRNVLTKKEWKNNSNLTINKGHSFWTTKAWNPIVNKHPRAIEQL